MIALDCETSGLDWAHGARPYLVTTCDEEGRLRWWEWPVDPRTREVQVDPADLREIRDLLTVIGKWGDDGPETAARHALVCQNGKFDCHALRSVGVYNWPWQAFEDTLTASHVLASNQPHDLTALAVQYLEEDIEPFEKEMEKCVQEARRFARRHHPDWAVAKEGRADMPSAKGQTWKIDAWLPRAIARYYQHPEPVVDCEHRFGKDRLCEECGGHQYWVVTQHYANADSATTIRVWMAQRQLLESRKLMAHYRMRMRLIPALWRMESRGVTGHEENRANLRTEYAAEVERTERELVAIAEDEGYELQVPKGARNDSLARFCFGYAINRCDRCNAVMEVDRNQVPRMQKMVEAGADCLNCKKNGIDPPGKPTFKEYPCLDLPVLKRSEDTGAPSMDKEVMGEYLATLDPESLQYRFVKALAAKRKRDTSLNFLDSYAKFWVPKGDNGCRILYPSINPTGTDTLRLSSSNPNAQQVDKHPDNRGFSLRSVFGPAAGREWWAVDYENLELRIPAFEADETELVNVFLHPDDPPYFGSYHLVIFDVLHPEKFLEFGKRCKDEFAATWYQWVKNGNFATLYGAQEEKADATYHVKGAYRLIRKRFPKMAALSDRMVKYADRYGFVETIPSKLVDPSRGYPLMVARSSYGKVEPTKPFNYHVQGTACETANLALIQCDEQIEEWRAGGFDAFVTLYVHDELVFDFPAGGRRNLPKVNRLVSIMEGVGEGIGVPLKAAWKYCPKNWAEHEEPK